MVRPSLGECERAGADPASTTRGGRMGFPIQSLDSARGPLHSSPALELQASGIREGWRRMFHVERRATSPVFLSTGAREGDCMLSRSG